METLDIKLQKQVKLASRKLGIEPEKIMEMAISSYLANIDEIASLQKELAFWNILTAKNIKKYKF